MNLSTHDSIEAVDLLDRLETRELTASDWDHVAHILSSMRDAIDSGDVAAFGTSVGDLEILSLDRASRTGRLVVLAPDPVKASASVLSHRLKSGIYSLSTQPPRPPWPTDE